ncbi:RNA polymerase sigma factor [Paraliomyxa miuraensis]|uniref:RNA polymerase sigma factor n=1 Tax=Paraliomyxa miuraensis TaxID=376150 RepID=UPI002251D2D8|nr:sigma-70 family RNA polymerase sigma factor [Paraliomyxa miuraensis]MCX4243272.1 sigma-70 family RNA polymerase sigma factor [Paraliomyxa miuraensis]
MAEDHELLEAWRGGDDRAGRRLVERHFATVERFFFNKVGDASADLIQQSFLRVLEARARVRADANFRAYLLGIARNVLYEHYRRVRKDLERIDFGSQSVVDLVATPSSQLAAEQEVRLLLRALKRIPIESQIVLELYYWEDMRAREVAEVLELPEGTVRSRIRGAKQLLEHQLAALATSQAQVESTTANLDQWAARIKAMVGGTPIDG